MGQTIQIMEIALALAGIIAFIWGQPWLRRIRHHRLQNRSLLPSQLVFLDTIPLYRSLPQTLQKRLQGHIQVVLAEKQFIGCQGLRVTDEMKLTIAAQASLLLLNDRGEYYPKLDSILVYPGAFRAERTSAIADYLVLQESVVESGEAWGRMGLVVLSWADIEYDLAHCRDGRNVVLHEFAHQLDLEEGGANGVPKLKHRDDYTHWAYLWGKTYEQFLYALERGRKTALDPYGATNAAEFFAVATETFWEKPKALQREYPQLYEQLECYYQCDPLEWKGD